MLVEPRTYRESSRQGIFSSSWLGKESYYQQLQKALQHTRCKCPTPDSRVLTLINETF